MSAIQIPEERRQKKRFKAVEGTFAALVDQDSRLGQIRDISLQGLSFRYIDNNEKLEETSELIIILGNRSLFLDKVPFEIISDFKIESEFSSSAVDMRQVGLKFGELTPQQKLLLNQIIEFHTIGEA